jgi:hypothetical protein
VIKPPDWDTAPAGDRYQFVDGGTETNHVLTPAGTRFFWNYIEGSWDKGYLVSVDKQLLQLIEEGLQPMATATKQKIETGDEVSFTGVVAQVTAYEVLVKHKNGNTSWFGRNNLEIVKKGEKPIPDQTIVTDTHGCKFILSDKKWIRIFSQEFGKEVGDVVGYDTYSGRALQRRAREALSV